MSIKRNNRFLMLFAIIFTVGQMGMGAITPRWGLYSLIPYLICIGVGLIIIKKDGMTFKELMPYNVGIKGSTALLIVLLVFLMFPLTTLLNQIGTNVGGDLMELFAQDLFTEDQTFIENLFAVAMIPAIFEEMFFRGFFFAGFKRARGARFGIIMSAILFGFFHMNVQQIGYAIVLGIILAVLREVTGSMWAGSLYHFINNGWAVVLLTLDDMMPDKDLMHKLPIERISFITTNEGTPSTGTVIYSIIMLIVFTTFAFFVLRKIVKNEGRADDWKKFFKKDDDPKEKIVTGGFVVTCLIYLSITVLIAVGMNLLGAAM